MKTIIICILLSFSYYFAQPKFDTVSTRNVGVGIVHLEILEPAMPWTIDVLEINLSDTNNRVESVKAQSRLLGYETVSEMASSRDSSGHTVIGAINGDFYAGGGIPIGKQIVNGEIVKQNSFYSSFAINEENQPAIDRPSFSGIVQTENAGFQIDNINSSRISDNLILYNSFFGPSTETNEFGTEAVIRPLDKWLNNDTILVTVESLEKSVGDIQIKKGYAVLSGHGVAGQFLDENVEIGDTLKLYLGFTTNIKGITQMIGGYPRIIRDGQNYVNQGYNEEGGPPHTFERHPRTAIGFSQDSTRLYFITVDGRGYSIGMTLNELADFMIDIGAHEGINLDGGGSTTMLVRNRIMNVPSDGSERSVANSMLVYTSYPKTDTLSSISISPSNLRIFKGERISLKVEGWDKYYNPMSIESDKVKYFLDSQIGSLDSNGVFTAGESSGNALIFAEYLGFKDTCMVFVKSIGKIEVMPKEILINSVMPFELKHSAWDIDGVPKNIEKDKFQWSVQDTSIASVSSQGVVSGKTDGSTLIYLHYEELKDSAMVRVINMSGKHILHSFDNTENLSLIGKNLNLNNSFIELASDPKSEGNSSLKIIYEYTGNSSQIYDVGLKTNIPIEGVPDSIEVDLQTNGYRNQMIFFFSDDNGERFQMNVKKWADVSEYLDLQPGAFSNITATGIGDIFNFPVTLTEMSIKLSGPKEDGVVYKDSLYIDNLRISYPEIATGIEVENPIFDYFKLNQNYPNPFNPLTKINYSIPFASTGELSMKHVKLTVYDILGRKVKILVNEIQDPGNYEITFNGQNLNSGVYFYELRTGSFRSVKKMMLVK